MINLSRTHSHTHTHSLTVTHTHSFTHWQVIEEGALQPVINLLGSSCQESQREAALLLGQFATTDTDTKVRLWCQVLWLFAVCVCVEGEGGIHYVGPRLQLLMQHAADHERRHNSVACGAESGWL